MTLDADRGRLRPNSLSLSQILAEEREMIDKAERAEKERAAAYKPAGQDHLRSHHDYSGGIQGSKLSWKDVPLTAERMAAENELHRRHAGLIPSEEDEGIVLPPVEADDFLVGMRPKKAVARAITKEDAEYGAASTRGAGVPRCEVDGCKVYALKGGRCLNHSRTPEERREAARRAGVASGEARRMRKAGYERDGLDGWRPILGVAVARPPSGKEPPTTD